MMKQGVTKIPIAKIPGLAEACSVNVANFVRIVMIEYHPEIWDVIQKHVGEVITDDEPEILQKQNTNKNIAYDIAERGVFGVCQTCCPPISCGVSDFRDADFGFGVKPDGSGGLPVAGFS